MRVRPHSRAALLMLVDGRFPSGGYAHSGGVEQAIANGHVSTMKDLEAFLVGRLRTTGLVSAAFAAAACRIMGDTTDNVVQALTDLDSELDARTSSPTQRATSRQLGRQMVRAVGAVADESVADQLPVAPHLAVALGSIFGRLGLGPFDAASACLHEIAVGAVTASVRLLSTDPFAAHGVQARLGRIMDELAKDAVRRSTNPRDLPSEAAPMLEINAERHVQQKARLFAS